MKMSPIFLISLPRSGSTLLQKMLSAHTEIHSVSEPWLLLPLAYMHISKGMFTEYDHEWAITAFDDFINLLPNCRKDFNDSTREFVISLYEKSLKGNKYRYFLDKTPRYYLIIPFLAEVFPEAKFIFLFRNPLDVISSILTTWLSNQLRLYRYYPDLFIGPFALAEGFKRYQDRSLAVLYEKLVTSPESEVKRICDYLDLSFDQTLITGYRSVNFDGEYGDNSGVISYHGVSPKSIAKWKNVLNTRYRKRFVKRYIQRLGNPVLHNFGTSVEDLIKEIDSIAMTRPGDLADFYWHLMSNLKRWLFIDYFKYMVAQNSRGRRYHH